MKAGRRHELHQNELAQWLGRVADWSKKHVNHITAIVLGLAVVFVAWMWISKHLSSRQDEVFHNYTESWMVESPEDRIKLLEKVADQDRNKFLAALANIELGDQYARNLTLAGKVDSGQNKDSLGKATAYYKTVVDKYGDQKPMVAMAYVGLGELAEDAAKWDEAKALYEKAQSTAPDGYPVLYRAKVALIRLEQVRAPLAMATTMPVSQPATTAPASGPALPGLPKVPATNSSK